MDRKETRRTILLELVVEELPPGRCVCRLEGLKDVGLNVASWLTFGHCRLLDNAGERSR
jgi:hypothetical protein